MGRRKEEREKGREGGKEKEGRRERSPVDLLSFWPFGGISLRPWEAQATPGVDLRGLRVSGLTGTPVRRGPDPATAPPVPG